MNATVQVLRAIPELQTVLTRYVEIYPALNLLIKAVRSGSASGLPARLGQLYASMSRTTDPFIPMQFLTSLRENFPQFAETTGASGKQMLSPMYAQQGDCFFCRQLDAPFWTLLISLQMRRNVILR